MWYVTAGVGEIKQSKRNIHADTVLGHECSVLFSSSLCSLCFLVPGFLFYWREVDNNNINRQSILFRRW